MTILDDILTRKAEEVAALRRDVSRAALEAHARSTPPARGFGSALRDASAPRVIAEFKRASPSRGVIHEGADPAAVARSYAAAGAAALSVLTDRDFFGGSLDDLRAARAACGVPVLRKDFTIDGLQILEARAAGADAILLIVAALDGAQLGELLAAGGEIGVDVLVEVHDRDELERALEVDAQIIGINNRDLRNFETDVSVTRALLPHVEGRTVVSESGLSASVTLRELEAEGVHAFLIGEALMAQPDPGEALAKLRGVG